MCRTLSFDLDRVGQEAIYGLGIEQPLIVLAMSPREYEQKIREVIVQMPVPVANALMKISDRSLAMGDEYYCRQFLIRLAALYLLFSDENQKDTPE